MWYCPTHEEKKPASPKRLTGAEEQVNEERAESVKPADAAETPKALTAGAGPGSEYWLP